MDVDGIENRVALVTGAAGGMGEAVVRTLAAHGAVVAMLDRNAEGLEELAARVRDSGGRAEAFPADVTDSAAVEAVVELVERRLGPLDHLVNGAGVLRPGRTWALTDEDWAATFAVNTAGVFHVSRAVVSRMIERRRGAIVTVASNASGTPRVDMAAYAASKAASTMFTKCLGLEVSRFGIRCNVVAPGSTDTPMLTALWDEGAERASIDGVASAFRVGIPLGRIARPQHIADAVVFLLSDRAAHITMQDLTVDGGAALGH
ncbi:MULTISPECIES: 2,3-dihydro-2,3-dihydroxybenzoate dehydrogenase [Streptomyces]|uniref:2,3-dihydro-2,3-dihydroxybenzoate dehydrogenase n=1 Tax=Streptomyces stelliscabiei TaxID=146820 RepID=A0A8I0PE22_9ACTN|nr:MULTISPECIES: 2,3-dihydro-2,3-dihydroxybenzoate dehydrogenase [Streptomyces]KND42882.1 2,3-dihydroxybenzoate-2,3-dehydrogenase [Streptomyces stelliscabiei]MBE1601854.1 2,3-dihydro-2,3-dihydroxybenzoate dehydrogenase [Streptomyces stelliscabiei]MDX2514080.1 2,3-dihydro-2,3-dihydroxybenzoate dehydrogenase [Streptomyces stelliscabiei]MDX2553462.1 2,3-dihydro-2,3-dihydroxybenzoate dehydrogenase [Streptomyces stelliscabiei]MDX2612498.1 2,3-dihydro-2,3-dihydroxybenzoate dehydrogenase [Streptomyce